MADQEGALANWLELRESADAVARSHDVTGAVVASLSRRRAVRALDLATGTGSNIRYLGGRLPASVEWLAIDRDAALLARVPRTVKRRRRELGRLDRAMFAGAHFVTASALLDLVSESWIRELATRCQASGAAVLFALNYDGRSECHPPEPEDDFVRDLFNRHQRASDKGFGRAAGPDAADAALRAFTDAGYQMRHARSDWELGPERRELQRLLIQGWADAAIEVAPEHTRTIESWLARRLAHVDAGRSRIVVGHVDVGGWIR
jgi:hypothetical protein